MKRFITLTAAALMVTAGAASAMNTASSVTLQEIRGYVPRADLSALSDKQIGHIQMIIHGGDDGEKGAWIRAYLLNAG